jgi:hypothetical protein
MTWLTRLTLLTRREGARDNGPGRQEQEPAALEALKKSLLHQAFSREV